jgi:hypothetical protein
MTARVELLIYWRVCQGTDQPMDFSGFPFFRKKAAGMRKMPYLLAVKNPHRTQI